MATWVILIVLVLAVSLIVRKLIRDRKTGGSCGCGRVAERCLASCSWRHTAP